RTSHRWDSRRLRRSRSSFRGDAGGVARIAPPATGSLPGLVAKEVASGLVSAGGESKDADHEASHPLSDGARHGGIAAHGGPQLTLEPTLELFEIGERERLDLEDGG